MLGVREKEVAQLEMQLVQLREQQQAADTTAMHQDVDNQISELAQQLQVSEKKIRMFNIFKPICLLGLDIFHFCLHAYNCRCDRQDTYTNNH